MLTASQRDLLGEELDPKRVEQRKGAGGKTFDYLEGWDVKRRANEVFDYDGWGQRVINVKCVAEGRRLKESRGRGEYEVYYAHYIAVVGVDVGRGADKVVREDTGYGNGESSNPGECHELAVKEAVTDAVKRAFSGWGPGFGLSLYDKSGHYRGDDFDDIADDRAPLGVEETGDPSDQYNERRYNKPEGPPQPSESRRREIVREEARERPRTEARERYDQRQERRDEERDDARARQERLDREVSRDREVAEREADKAREIRDRVEQRAAARKLPNPIEPPMVSMSAPYADRKKAWNQYGKLFAEKMRQAGGCEAAEDLIEANRDGLEKMTEASVKRKGGKPELDGLRWAHDLRDELYASGGRDDEPRRQSVDDYEPEPNEKGILETPVPATPANWKLWAACFERMIQHTKDEEDALDLIEFHKPELEKYSSFEQADMREWAVGAATDYWREKTRRQRDAA